MPVSPQRCISAIASLSALLYSAAVGAGTFSSSTFDALSTNTPVGLPLASLMICPPTGAFEAAVTPATFIAAMLAYMACPSTRSNSTG